MYNGQRSKTKTTLIHFIFSENATCLTMAEFTSQGGILRGQDVVSILFPVAVIPLLFLLRSVFFYVKARSQFPGPPIRNFWVGNLDQTMANDVHEKAGIYQLLSLKF